MKTIHVEVTQEDIAMGVPKRSDRCAIASAVRRAAGCECSIGGGCTNSLYPGGGYIVGFWLPDIAERFRNDFDTRQPVSPIAFDIEVDL